MEHSDWRCVQVMNSNNFINDYKQWVNSLVVLWLVLWLPRFSLPRVQVQFPVRELSSKSQVACSSPHKKRSAPFSLYKNTPISSHFQTAYSLVAFLFVFWEYITCSVCFIKGSPLKVFSFLFINHNSGSFQ